MYKVTGNGREIATPQSSQLIPMLVVPGTKVPLLTVYTYEGVQMGVGVAVAVAVAVAVGVDVGVAVAGAVAVGVEVGVGLAQPPVLQ